MTAPIFKPRRTEAQIFDWVEKLVCGPDPTRTPPVVHVRPETAPDWDDLDDTTLVPTGKSARELPPDRLAKTDVASGISLGKGDSVATVARFPCSKCRGSGRFISFAHRDCGPCNRCHGTGKQKTDPAKAAKKKLDVAKQHAATMLQFTQEHKPELEWMSNNASRFGFAASLLQAFGKHGCLTDNQLAAVQRCMAKDAERAAKPPDASVQGGGFDRMLKAFAAAKASGLLRPKFRVANLLFKIAGPRSTFVGQLTVLTNDNVYLGRIDGRGQFFKGRDCDNVRQALIIQVCRDPLAAAVMHGQQSGSCSCCGQTLTNEESIRLGIGPICRGRWGLQ